MSVWKLSSVKRRQSWSTDQRSVSGHQRRVACGDGLQGKTTGGYGRFRSESGARFSETATTGALPGFGRQCVENRADTGRQRRMGRTGRLPRPQQDRRRNAISQLPHSRHKYPDAGTLRSGNLRRAVQKRTVTMTAGCSTRRDAGRSQTRITNDHISRRHVSRDDTEPVS